jgi:hypothetical protein
MFGLRAFLDEDFLLTTATARRLDYEHVESQPIVDYHTHLSAAAIADDHRFRDLTEIWLEGDHYKWRAIGACGIVETPLHGRCACVREVSRVGKDGARHAAQSALPLDPPGTKALLRNFGLARC